MNELLSILEGHTSIEEALEFYQLIYRAVKENAYIHPGWDYLRYPSVTLIGDEICCKRNGITYGVIDPIPFNEVLLID